MVKTKLRYSFFRSEEYSESGDEFIAPGSDIIGETASLVRSLEDTIDVGTLLYRGRPEDGNGPYSFFGELTAPPVEAAKENRMSPYGISMFYGSYDKDTPIKEIKNYLKNKDTRIYLGEFEVTKTLKVINLCNTPQPDFWMGKEGDWKIFAFLRAFHKEISKPVGTNDPKLEYIPSQVFCEYLRHIQKAKDGSSYDGIVYSSAMTNEKNVVLFYDNKGSAEVLKLKSASIVDSENHN
jgi:RES domain-containing protein